MDDRRCEGCSKPMPRRLHRETRADGKRVCAECMSKGAQPEWASTAAQSTRYPGGDELRAHLVAEHGWSEGTVASIHEADRHHEHVGLHELGEQGVLAPAGHQHVSLRPVGGLRAEAHESSDGYPSRMQVTAHESSDDLEVMHCFAGETRYLTREGVKTLAETVGTAQQVLTSTAGVEHARHSGRWVQAEIRDFGQQRLWRVRVQRNRVTKDLYATEGHRWLVQSGPGRAFDRFVTTEALGPEMRLSHLRAPRVITSIDREGARRGVHFGDGWTLERGGCSYGSVTLWGEKAKYLADLFSEIGAEGYERTTPSGVSGVSFSSKMNGYTKSLPSEARGNAHLYGWLAGYFAADGSVGRDQVALNSSSRETLEHVRDICSVLGIGTYGISTKMRKGYGAEPTPSYDLTFARNDLTPEFFLRGDHRERFERMSSRPDRFGWTVVDVTPTDRVETVYCAVVPESESFVLEDNIWTGNCPWCGSGQITGNSDGTITCAFAPCGRTFTVRLQPTFPAMPQSIDGAPFPPGAPGADPGMPGDELPGEPPAGDPIAEGGGDAPFPPDDEEAPPEGGEEDDEVPAFLKGSTLRTSEGAELSVEAYLRHLALVESGYDEAVLEQVRADSLRDQ